MYFGRESDCRLKKYLSHTLLGVISFVFILAFITGIFLEKHDLQIERIETIHNTHATLTSLIAPELSIYNIMEIRKILALTSSRHKLFAVIDDDRNIYMSDYSDLNLIKGLMLNKANIDCHTLEHNREELDIKGIFYCSTIYYREGAGDAGNKLGILVSFNYYESSFSSWRLLTGSLLLLSLISGLFFVLVKVKLNKKLLSPLLKLEKQITRLDYSNMKKYTKIGDIGWAPIEIRKIKDAFDHLLSRLYIENIKIRESEKKATLSDLAMQIAHDIRSPLAALDVLSIELDKFSENKRLLVKHAISRINDIANNLLTQYRLIKHADRIEIKDQLSLELLSALIDMILSEKRLQINNSNIGIHFDIEQIAYGVFARINSSELKRILSNILNNAIEAISGLGNIYVYLRVVSNQVLIEINDNGCGIPAHILPSLCHKRESYKKDGFGLGLSSAVHKIKEWGGGLSIESEVNIGTTVKISLPLAKPPRWFAEKIYIKNNIRYVVVLDDERSIHQIWKTRFLELSKSGLKVIHLTKPGDLVQWKNKHNVEQAIFFIDYCFDKSMTNGLSLIKDCNLESYAFLVTSCYEEEILRQNCVLNGIKILPKFFSNHIPIEFISHEPVDLILLDNDPLVTKTWELVCRLKNRTIKTFSNLDDFFVNLRHFSKQTPIYIDYELANNITGDDISREVYIMGYRDIYLVTGREKANFSNLYWIKAVCGKECPI